ncbi:hypothetical protein [Scytonema millei]|uniref:Uncharacterized protein n=1 Tax=Scytonema millei VB511283 TaxID=1245923 RepID=A0A9X5E0N7_9CYAN|nr:hypothetical protein [Scytonema millei]NHC33352.1 hypothetical protein [Scytonema millei VB511283]
MNLIQFEHGSRELGIVGTGFREIYETTNNSSVKPARAGVGRRNFPDWL